MNKQAVKKWVNVCFPDEDALELERKWAVEKHECLIRELIRTPSTGNLMIAGLMQYWKRKEDRDEDKESYGKRIMADIAQGIAAMSVEQARKVLDGWEDLAPHKRREGMDPNYGSTIRQKARAAWLELQEAENPKP